MWILQLNDMRSPKVEILTAVARAETKEALLAFLDREKIDVYYDNFSDAIDKQWCKSFRSGGPLEWFNYPFNLDCPHFVEIGTREECVLRAVRRAETYWDDEIDSLPTV